MDSVDVQLKVSPNALETRLAGGCFAELFFWKQVCWRVFKNILEFMAVVSLWLVWFRSRCRGSTYNSGLSVS